MTTLHSSSRLSRRHWLQLSSLGLAGFSVSGWLDTLASETARHPDRRRSCILLWMTGGPSQIDTLDMKPGHSNGGPFKPIETSVPGLRISEHLPKLARVMEHVVPIRSMSTKEGDHARATYQLRTGYKPVGPIHYPTLGSLLSKELGTDEAELPNYVAIAPNRSLNPSAYGPGFLGPAYAPLIVGGSNAGPGGNTSLQVKNLDLPRGINQNEADERLMLLDQLETDFTASRPGIIGTSHRAAYRAAVKMMRSEAVKAFQLDEESAALRETYGRHLFGQGCLLARRLVERGVPIVEVSLNGVQGTNTLGWDTHINNFENVRRLCTVLDSAWSSLITDLKDRGLLESTLIVWMGEFGRTPEINRNQGRDHFPAAWTMALAGGGIRGGQTLGRTSDDGMQVVDRPVAVPDLMATICRALGVDPMNQNLSNVGRPIRLADPEAKPIEEIL